MQITKHAKERYAERIMDKGDTRDINLFITQNEEKIKTDIEKMVNYGEQIFSGRTTGGKPGCNPVNVYRNGLWIILEDSKSHDVITLYKIELGADEDFDTEFVNRMMVKLDEAKSEQRDIEKEIAIERENYQSLVRDGEDLINTYKGYIKNLEQMNAGYKAVIDSLQVKNSLAEQKIKNIIARLIGKKEF